MTRRGLRLTSDFTDGGTAASSALDYAYWYRHPDSEFGLLVSFMHFQNLGGVPGAAQPRKIPAAPPAAAIMAAVGRACLRWRRYKGFDACGVRSLVTVNGSRPDVLRLPGVFTSLS